MWRKLILLTSFVLVLGFVSVTGAADIVWSGGGNDNLWSNPANWEGNKVPTAGDDALIEVPGAQAPNGPLIQDGIDAECSVLWNEVAGEPEMRMTGGTLTMSGWGIWWGDGPGCNPTFYQSGGTVTLSGSPGVHEFGWGGSAGTWIMTGGTVNAKGVSIPSGPGNSGEIQLHGGTYNVGTARGGLVMREGSLINITAGALVLEGDVTANIDGLIAEGKITAYGGAGQFEIDYDATNPGFTIVTAMEAGKAYKPDPADGSIYEDTWASLSWSPADGTVSHDVYFGEDLDEVSTGAGDSFRANQGDTFYIVGFPGYPYPDGLVPGTTYYWRIDEIEADGTINPGDVWSFTIPPKTAFNPNPADGAEFVDVDVELSWMAGFSALLHTVYFGDSFDDVSTAAGGISQGDTTYRPFFGPLELEKVYYWRVDEFDGADTYKGDVWAFSTPGAVGNPDPANGATGVQMNATLGWTPADSATSSEVYLGTDKDAVRSATSTSPEYRGSKLLGSESFDPGKLAWHSAYYWRVDSIDSTNAASPWKGNVWSFETADFITVDDFESYNDLAEGDPGSNRIYLTWLDGLGTTTNGSVVGYADLPLVEHGDVHGGGSSMPYSYDNDGKYSEAGMTLVYPRDWTEEAVGVLSLWFNGDASNAAEPMYVILNGSAAVYNNDPGAAQAEDWTEWTIDLQKFASQGVDLTNVASVGIGFGDKNNLKAGGSGKMLFDDIRLFRPPPPPVGHWKLDDGQGAVAADSSGHGNDGAIGNLNGGLGPDASVWVDDPERGTVISFNGTAEGAFVRAGDIPQMTLTNDFTWSFWAKHSADNTADNDIILGNRYNGDGVDFVPRQFIKFTPTKFEWHMNGNGDDNLDYDDIPADVWLHHAVVKTADQLTYYRNGIEASSGTFTQALDFPQPLYFGGDNTGSAGENWAGLMSDVRIYDRALSAAEVLGLASQ